MREHVDPSVRARAVQAARGTAPFDLLLVGGTVVDVGTGLLKEADVGVVGPLIASVHPRGTRTDAAEVVDVTGRHVAPGFIDMHVHFESSMLTPGPYAAAVAPRGTTTVFADPHELANVVGVDGVRYAVDASRGLPVRFIVQAPSCVPPQPGLELSGYDVDPDEVATMLSWPEVGGVAEVMDMLGVLGADERMVGVVAAGLESGKLVSGHAASLRGPELQAYLAAGIDSDHEIFVEGDVMARLDAGMTVELRGEVAAVLPEVVAQLADLPELPTHLVLCTDDLFANTLLRAGGLDRVIRMLVELGLPPVRAIRLATYHAAYRLGRPDLGLVAAGRRADLLVIGSLEDVEVLDVYTDGRLVASGGRMVVDVVEGPARAPYDTLHLEPLAPSDFVVRLPGAADGPVTVRTVDGRIMTSWGQLDVDVVDGAVVLPDGAILQAVVHRHGRIEPEVRLTVATGWGDPWTGAIATTVSHDTHNLVVFGRHPDAMAAAANRVIADGGGVAVAVPPEGAGGDAEVAASIALPVAGILSPLPCEEVAALQDAVEAAAARVGLPPGALSQPLMQVMASSLACLPGPHLTDLGVVDGDLGVLVTDLVVG